MNLVKHTLFGHYNALLVTYTTSTNNVSQNDTAPLSLTERSQSQRTRFVVYLYVLRCHLDIKYRLSQGVIFHNKKHPDHALSQRSNISLKHCGRRACRTNEPACLFRKWDWVILQSLAFTRIPRVNIEL